MGGVEHRARLAVGQCGDVLSRMVQTYGSDLSVIIQAGQASAENLISGPRKRDDTVTPTGGSGQPRS